MTDFVTGTQPEASPMDEAGDLAAKLFADEPEQKEVQAPAQETQPEAREAAPEPEPTPEPEPVKDDPRVEYERKISDLQRERDEFTSRGKAEVAQERKRYQDGLAQYVHLAERLDPVIAEGLKTDWTKLARENPAEWAARKAEFDQRMDTLNRARQELSRQQENEILERLSTNYQKLVEAWPEWGDEVKRAEIQKELRPYMKTWGFSDKEINDIVDYRAFIVMKKAMAYDKWTKAQSEAAKKKIAEAPKVVAKPQAQAEAKSANSRIEALLKKTQAGNPREVGELAAALEW